MNKETLLTAVRLSRKKNGKDHPKTLKAIYRVVQNFPYYNGYEEYWLRNNEYRMNKDGN